MSGGGLGSVGESQALTPLNNPKVQVNNKLTRVARNIAIGLVFAAALGAIVTFTAHGGVGSAASDVMVFSGGAAVLSGGAYLGLRFARDRMQANKAKDEFERKVAAGDAGFADVGEEIGSLKNGATMEKEVKLHGKKYLMRVLKKDNGVHSVNLKNK